VRYRGILRLAVYDRSPGVEHCEKGDVDLMVIVSIVLERSLGSTRLAASRKPSLGSRETTSVLPQKRTLLGTVLVSAFCQYLQSETICAT
jgi:hypothetical protein